MSRFERFREAHQIRDDMGISATRVAETLRDAGYASARACVPSICGRCWNRSLGGVTRRTCEHIGARELQAKIELNYDDAKALMRLVEAEAIRLGDR